MLLSDACKQLLLYMAEWSRFYTKVIISLDCLDIIEKLMTWTLRIKPNFQVILVSCDKHNIEFVLLLYWNYSWVQLSKKKSA